MGKTTWGRKQRLLPSAIAAAWLMPSAALAVPGLVDLRLEPSTQTVAIGDSVSLGVIADSQNQLDQSVGFLGVVVVWDAQALALTGHSNSGAFGWSSSGFPSDGAGVNATHLDGTAYFRAIVQLGGSLATATPTGSLMTTLQFTALPSSSGSTSVTIVPCIDTTCTMVLSAHPFEPGASNITGELGAGVEVNVTCQSNAECDDSNPCTDDSCSAGNTCTFVPNDTNDADDGLFCNGTEMCENGNVVVIPGTTPDCDDGLACTEDFCALETDACAHNAILGQCWVDDACFENGQRNPFNDCEACSTAVDSLNWTPLAPGTSCGSQVATQCNRPDTCDGAGLCEVNLVTSGAPCGDSSTSVCTTPDSCDGAGFCQGNHTADGTPCNDGNFCSVTDSCQLGICTGSGNPCAPLTCDEFTNRCKSVRFELLPSKQGPLAVGEIVEIQLVAGSDTALDQPISGLSVILNWPSAFLELIDHLDNGPYTWLLSSFPNDSALDGLNNSFLDGNALYQATSMPAPAAPAIATTSGLLVTTLQFQARLPGSVSVEMIAASGSFSRTTVLDAESTGLDITGTLATPADINIVECLIHNDCDDGEFCTGVETCVDMFCVAGTPPDCDDQIFCNGSEVCEVSSGCVSLGNPCPDPNSCDEGAGNCGGCAAPAVEAEGCRYVAITPSAGIDPIALQIVIDPEGAPTTRYVTADGSLGLDPVFRLPQEWGTVHVTHGLITPSTRFDVRTDCRFDGSGFLSNARSVTTWVWGDANGDGASQVDDISLVFAGSQGNFQNGATVENLDMSPCLPNRAVDAEDTQVVQDAFSNTPYPYVPPCEACTVAASPTASSSLGPLNRLLVIQPGNAGRSTAIRVTLFSAPPPFESWIGTHLFAGTPIQVCENSGQGFAVTPPDCSPAPGLTQSWFWAAPLQCDEQNATFMDWSSLANYCIGGANDGGVCAENVDCGLGTCGIAATEVFLYGNGMIPSRMASSAGPLEAPATYVISMVDEACELNEETSYSAGLSLTQAGWGDVVTDCTGCPCGPANESIAIVTDVVALVNKFSNQQCAPNKGRAELDPATTDFLISIADVLRGLRAFTGEHFPFNNGACTDNTCVGGPLDGNACALRSDCVPALCPPN